MKFHYFALTGSFVINATQVQHAMNDDAVQFVLLDGMNEESVRGDSIERNHHVARDALPRAVIKRDNVGIVIMVEETAIGVEDIFIVTKNIGQPPYPFSMCTCYRLNPFFEFELIKWRHIHIFSSKVYFHCYYLVNKLTKITN